MTGWTDTSCERRHETPPNRTNVRNLSQYRTKVLSCQEDFLRSMLSKDGFRLTRGMLAYCKKIGSEEELRHE